MGTDSRASMRVIQSISAAPLKTITCLCSTGVPKRLKATLAVGRRRFGAPGSQARRGAIRSKCEDESDAAARTPITCIGGNKIDLMCNCRWVLNASAFGILYAKYMGASRRACVSRQVGRAVVNPRTWWSLAPNGERMRLRRVTIRIDHSGVVLWLSTNQISRSLAKQP